MGAINFCPISHLALDGNSREHSRIKMQIVQAIHAFRWKWTCSLWASIRKLWHLVKCKQFAQATVILIAGGYQGSSQSQPPLVSNPISVFKASLGFQKQPATDSNYSEYKTSLYTPAHILCWYESIGAVDFISSSDQVNINQLPAKNYNTGAVSTIFSPHQLIDHFQATTQGP